MASSEAQKSNPSTNTITHTPNARRKVMMDFSSLHPCSVSTDEDDEKEEENIHSHSHPSYYPTSSYSSSSSTPTQSSQVRSIINNNARLEYYNASSLGNESTSKAATTSRFRSKSKSKGTTAHVHFLDQVIEANTTAAASANVNASRKRSTPSDLDTNTTTNEEKGMTLGPRSRDLSLSESEISLLDLGPSLVFGDEGYMPLAEDNGQGDEGGGVSLVGRGVQGLCLERGGDGVGLRK